MSYAVGRIVTVRLLRRVTGTWAATSSDARYWQPGGQLGDDVTPSAGFMELPRPQLGQLMVAFTTDQTVDLDPGEGELLFEIGALFPVDEHGKVITPDPTETIRVDALESALGA